MTAYDRFRKIAVKGFVWPTVIGGLGLAALMKWKGSKSVSNPATQALSNRQKQLEEANALAENPSGLRPGG